MDKKDTIKLEYSLVITKEEVRDIVTLFSNITIEQAKEFNDEYESVEDFKDEMVRSFVDDETDNDVLYNNAYTSYANLLKSIDSTFCRQYSEFIFEALRYSKELMKWFSEAIKEIDPERYTRVKNDIAREEREFDEWVERVHKDHEEFMESLKR